MKKLLTLLLLTVVMGQSWIQAQKIPELDDLSLRERVAQLMVIRVPLESNGDKAMKKFMNDALDNRVGGVCFFAGTTEAHRELIQKLNKKSRYPMLICIDGETGVAMRLRDVSAFPSQMLLGAMPPSADTLILEMGDVMGQQCRALGVHVNFAPVVDINTNPRNPIIGNRSFGQDKTIVAHKASLLVKGMQRQGILAVAKHFPGHGDTETDSHKTLPVEAHSAPYIDSVNLYPFRQLINEGVGGVMVAHLRVPAYTEDPVSSLSHDIVEKLLCEELQFNGLVITDGLDMKAVTNTFSKGQASLEALKAGSDLLLLPEDVEEALDAICDAAEEDPSLREQIDYHCDRVLKAKQLLLKNKAGKNTSMQSQRVRQLSYEMALQAVTLLRDDGVLLDSTAQHIDLNKSNVASVRTQLDTVADSIPLILTIYDKPYLLDKLRTQLDTMHNPVAILVAYDDSKTAHQAVETLLAQGPDAKFVGHLPVDAGGYALGEGLRSPTELPRPDVLCPICQTQDSLCRQVDSIVRMAIDEKAFPGCQILMAHQGEVVFDRCYGTYTYSEASPKVTSTTRYDLASVTKVAATTLAVMRLVEEGRVDLDAKVSKYLPALRHGKHSKTTVREVLSHIARLNAGAVLWRNCDLTGDRLPDSTARAIRIIADTKPLKEKHKYLYSDLGFILMGEMVKRVSGVPLDRYVDSCFYRPLGMAHTCFNPLLHGVSKSDIAPTEYDTLMRGGLVCGTVHDPNAAAMGGVAGHAGLFSTAEDLAILYNTLLGYGDVHILSDEVKNTFNQRYFTQYGNRRALGYDKPLFHPVETGNTALSATQSSYGHTGFTGTMVWVDPEADMVYIFLCNRVYPNTKPNKLAALNIRTDIQQLFYQMIGR